MKKQVKLTISGKVQGVCYRDAAQKQARKLSITGWVRNMPDGTVEILCRGESGAIEKFISWCKNGSPAASVRSVDVEKQPLDNEKLHDSFDIVL